MYGEACDVAGRSNVTIAAAKAASTASFMRRPLSWFSCLLSATTADASSSRDAYLSAGPTLQGRLDDTLDRLGAKLVRYTVDWRRVAKGTRLRVLYLPGGPASAEKVSTRPIAVH